MADSSALYDCALSVLQDSHPGRVTKTDREAMTRGGQGWIWRGPGIEIVTAKDPMLSERGFAGYIGIRGDKSVVREAKRLIKQHATYLKDKNGTSGLDYIGFD